MMAEIAILKKRKREPGGNTQPKKRNRIIRAEAALGTEVHNSGFVVTGDQHRMKIKSSTVLNQAVASNAVPLSVDARIPLHPWSVNSYRLRQLSKLFTSYRFTEMVVKWVPRVPTNTIGSVGVMYLDDISTAAASTLTNASNQNLSGGSLEAAIIESEDGFITPIWNPCVCFYDHLLNEQNNWFRISLGSGMILDEMQGCLILCEGSNLAVGTELGFFELSYSIEFAHPVSPLTVAVNGTLGSSGMTIPWSTLTGLVNYQISASTTDLATFNYWSKAQGAYLSTNSIYDYTAATTNWEYPCYLGQSYIIVVKCFVTGLSSTNTSFTFYASFGAYQNQDPIALSTGSVPTVNWSGMVMYLIVGTDMPNILTPYNLTHQPSEAKQPAQGSPAYTNSPFSSLSSHSIEAGDRIPEQIQGYAIRR